MAGVTIPGILHLSVGGALTGGSPERARVRKGFGLGMAGVTPPGNGPGRKRVSPHHGRYAAWKGAHEEQTPGFQPKFSEPAPSGQDCTG